MAKPKTVNIHELLDLFNSAIHEHEGLDDGTKAIMSLGVSVASFVSERVESIDESLKSIAASQKIIAKEAKKSLEMLDEAQKGEPSDAGSGDDWRNETL